jgi:hypothetical protein
MQSCWSFAGHYVATFTTEVGFANLKSNPLLLGRIDTNDLPKSDRLSGRNFCAVTDISGKTSCAFGALPSMKINLGYVHTLKSLFSTPLVYFHTSVGTD